MTHILAIDQGTTNTKALLVDRSGAVIASASRPMTVDYPEPGWAEQSADAIWAAVKAVVDELAAHSRIALALLGDAARSSADAPRAAVSTSPAARYRSMVLISLVSLFVMVTLLWLLFG